tara:strand:- start:630 stop:920 length:291 start_codon:yes stop_codon:yes gene_type:complete
MFTLTRLGTVTGTGMEILNPAITFETTYGLKPQWVHSRFYYFGMFSALWNAVHKMRQWRKNVDFPDIGPKRPTCSRAKSTGTALWRAMIERQPGTY